ncbi:HlyD family efflux transporter periplasmic adaptor subunit [Cognatiyoonia sp. IB215446]|uniref:HlyD family efflux transporter periplasmic adaptor subunit n=1 Tax=Cognatiyoonia sp. IB215446 TaxID=3097355 RepID=UPI002A12E825|nr:HlyD family efflux transporter periplasmic adaptor subunit [Cognatiyoonia sp. IB215446]MDX8346904.1 HlyD family efflux transporter periplasmic adaptor subunit [Cognatiyoonia sp. IB215446]
MSDLSFQVRAPLGLELNSGEQITVSNWSLQGFEFPYDSDVLPKGAILSIPFQGVDIRFPVRLKRNDDTQFLSFDGLTGRQRETLAVFYRSILSGKMASTEEVITSLDTPVDLVPMEETEEEKTIATEGKSPRSLRAALSVFMYLCLGAIVFWTLGAGVWNKLAHVEIQNARIEAQLLPHKAAQRGFVKEVLVSLDQPVARGDVLVRLTDPEGEAALEDVRSRIELIEGRLATAMITEERLANRIAGIRSAIIAAMQPSFPQIERLLAAFDGLYAKDHVDLFAAHEAALLQVDSLSDELRRLKRERGRLRDAGDALHVVAQTDGIVAEIAVIQGQLAARGSDVAVIEAAEARLARGWLDSSMSAAIFPGMEVAVMVAGPQGPRQLKGAVHQVAAGIDPEISPDFGMLVAVHFGGLTVAETRQALPHLAPVEMEAKRPWIAEQEERWDVFLAQFGF